MSLRCPRFAMLGDRGLDWGYEGRQDPAKVRL